MTFRSHHAAFALACFAMTAASGVFAGDTGAPIVLEGKALRADAATDALVKPKGQLTTAIPVSFEMRGRLDAQGNVELVCSEAGHGVLGPHEHRDGRGEEIR